GPKLNLGLLLRCGPPGNRLDIVLGDLIVITAARGRFEEYLDGAGQALVGDAEESLLRQFLDVVEANPIRLAGFVDARLHLAADAKKVEVYAWFYIRGFGRGMLFFTDRPGR